MRKYIYIIFCIFSFLNSARPQCYSTISSSSPTIYYPHIFAGNYIQSGYKDTTALFSMFNYPKAIIIDSAGNIIVADMNNHVIRKISPQGIVSTVAGTGLAGYTDGPSAAAQFNQPSGLCMDSKGNIFVSDAMNNMIRKISVQGDVSTFAGSGATGGIDGTGTGATFFLPGAITIDNQDNLYVVESALSTMARVRTISPAAVVVTLAGQAGAGFANGFGAAAKFLQPADIIYNASDGYLYIADKGNNCIRRMTKGGTVSTIAGSTISGLLDGVGTNARFYGPRGIAVDPEGNLFIADTDNNRIRKIILSNATVSTLNTDGSLPNTPALKQFGGLIGIIVDRSNTLIVSDVVDHVFRKVYDASERCPGDSVTLTAIPVIGTPSWSYNWIADGFSLGNGSPLLVTTPDSTSFIKLIATDNNGCKTEKEFVIIFRGTIVSAGSDSAVCVGDSAALKASGGIAYQWSPAAGLSNPSIYNPRVKVDSTTSFIVTVTNVFGCKLTDTARIIIRQPPAVDAGSASSVCRGSAVKLNATGNGNFSWSPPDGLSNTLIPNPDAAPYYTTMYKVLLTDSNNCKAIDSVTVPVRGLSLGFIANADTISRALVNGFPDSTGKDISFPLTPVTGMTADESGNLYFLAGYKKIFKKDPQNIITVVADSLQLTTYYSDGDFCMDLNHNIYIPNYRDSMIVKITPSGERFILNKKSKLISGGVSITVSRKGIIYCTDGIRLMRLRNDGWYDTLKVLSTGAGIRDLKCDKYGNVFMACNGYIAKYDTTGNLTTLAANSSMMSSLNRLSIDMEGNIFFSQYNNPYYGFYKVTPSGKIINVVRNFNYLNILPDTIIKVFDDFRQVNSFVIDSRSILSFADGNYFGYIDFNHYCPNTSVPVAVKTWDVSDSLSMSFAWFRDTALIGSGSSLTAVPPSTTTYKVTGTADGCSVSDSVTIRTLNANAGADRSLILGQSTNLTARNGLTPPCYEIMQNMKYAWKPVSWVVDTLSWNTFAYPHVTTTYGALITDAFGCTDEDSIKINVTGDSLLFEVNGMPLISNSSTDTIGQPTYGYADGPPDQVLFEGIECMLPDADHSLLIMELNRIRRYDPKTNLVSTILGPPPNNFFYTTRLTRDQKNNLYALGYTTNNQREIFIISGSTITPLSYTQPALPGTIDILSDKDGVIYTLEKLPSGNYDYYRIYRYFPSGTVEFLYADKSPVFNDQSRLAFSADSNLLLSVSAAIYHLDVKRTFKLTKYSGTGTWKCTNGSNFEAEYSQINNFTRDPAGNILVVSPRYNPDSAIRVRLVRADSVVSTEYEGFSPFATFIDGKKIAADDSWIWLSDERRIIRIERDAMKVCPGDSSASIKAKTSSGVSLVITDWYEKGNWFSGSNPVNVSLPPQSQKGFGIIATDSLGTRYTGYAALTSLSAPVPSISLSGNILTSTPAATYQWFYNGAPVSGAVSQTHTAIYSGWYYVTVTDSVKGCKGISDSIFVNIVGIRDLANSTGVIGIEPNPHSTNTVIRYTIEKESSVSLELFSPIGEKIVSLVNERKVPGEYYYDLNTEKISFGFYFIKFTAGSTSNTFKIIKIK